MNELVERYVHQVGRHVPPKERAEIEAELRSQIQDQLDDRFGGSPTQADVVAVLTELGDPRKMAVSYGGERYLIGPDLYPYMMGVLRYGWLLVPEIVIFLTVFGAMVSSQQTSVIGLLIESLVSAAQATLIFSAVVVLIFAIIQHSGEKLDDMKKAFNPLELPEVDEPGSVDRFEAAFGIAIGTFLALVSLYWLRVGGLTLRFDLNNPGDVIPVPVHWLFLLIITTIVMVILHLLALRRSRWSIALWLSQGVLELIGAFGVYFVFLRPLFERLSVAVPGLFNIPLFDRSPEIIAASMAIITLLDKGSKLVKLMNYRRGSAAPITVRNGG